MKKILYYKILALAFALVFATANYAQPSSLDFDKTTLMSSVKVLADADKLALNTLKTENAKVFREFSRDFRNPTDIYVSTQGNYTFIHCKVQGVVNRALYNKTGKCIRIVRTYDESRLSPEIANLIKGNFPCYSIFNVVEVVIGERTVYMVNIEGDKLWKVIKVEDGEMQVYKEYVKA